MVIMPGAPVPEPPPAGMESLYELILAGGPLMIPIGICSVVALAYSTERWIRLQPAYLGSRAFGRTVVTAVKEKGVAPALELCSKKRSPLSRILTTGLRRANAPFLDREKAVEDTAASEMRRLATNLRPLLLVWLIAPLLGLLGTVWGMIEAFSEIAMQEGLGRPELLASGIYQALTTTAAGLAVSIPAIVAYHFLKGRIEKFARHTEEFYRELDDHLAGGPDVAVA
jgi:biopolymer transport protein ExbB